jgi:ADP-ribosyltransferase exoenzyme
MTNTRPFLNADQETAYGRSVNINELPKTPSHGIGMWGLFSTPDSFKETPLRTVFRDLNGPELGHKLPKEHYEALQSYTNAHYHRFNRVVSGEGHEDAEQWHKMAGHLQEAITQNAKPLDQHFVTVHGLRYAKRTYGVISSLRDATAGQKVRFKGFVSSSVNASIAAGFSNNGPRPETDGPEPYKGVTHQHMVVFHHPAGKRTGLYLGSDRSLTTTPVEQEFLLPHGSTGTYLGRETHTKIHKTQPSGHDPWRGPDNEYTHVHSHLHIHHIELDGL